MAGIRRPPPLLKPNGTSAQIKRTRGTSRGKKKKIARPQPLPLGATAAAPRSDHVSRRPHLPVRREPAAQTAAAQPPVAITGAHHHPLRTGHRAGGTYNWRGTRRLWLGRPRRRRCLWRSARRRRPRGDRASRPCRRGTSGRAAAHQPRVPPRRRHVRDGPRRGRSVTPAAPLPLIAPVLPPRCGQLAAAAGSGHTRRSAPRGRRRCAVGGAGRGGWEGRPCRQQAPRSRTGWRVNDAQTVAARPPRRRRAPPSPLRVVHSSL